jgi:hypothetical protein
MPAATWDGRRWGLALAAIAVAGVLLRVVYVLVVLDPVLPGLDATWYQLQGGSIRHGTGYVHPPTLFLPEQVATAAFPPAYPTYQAAWQWLFGGSLTSVRLAGIVPGAAGIGLVGVLGRRVLGPGAGLLAAGLVALDPTLLAVDGSAMSESLGVALVLAVVLVAHQALAAPTWPRVVALGGLCGVAVLNRPDLLVLAGGVAALLAWRSRRVPAAAAVLGVAALVVVPWAIRNERAVGELTIATLSPSSALAGSYCDATFGGADLGSWSYDCVVAATPPGSPTEAEVASAQREAALDHLGDHLGRLPLVVAAREARVWSFWDPRDLAERDNDESRRYGWQLVSRPVDAALTLVGVVGLVALARRRRDDLVLLLPFVVVCLGAAAVHGNPRFAAIAHPSLALGAAALYEVRKDRMWPFTTSGASRWRK